MKQLFEKTNLIKLAKWLLLSLSIGIVGGLIGFSFCIAISAVTHVREGNSFTILFLPLAAVLSVGLNELLKTSGIATNDVVVSAKRGKVVTHLLLPAIFISSTITHLFGGSAGREGAALQMGGGAASLLSKVFKLDEYESRTLIKCGMASFFAALFGTPLAACVFAIEVAFDKSSWLKSTFPALVASTSAYYVSFILGNEGERFNVSAPVYGLSLIFKSIVISICAGMVGSLFCLSLKYFKRFAKLHIKNAYLIAITGSVAVVLLTIIVGNQDYNGSGSHLIEKVFTGEHINSYDFALKALFTVLTVSASLKGGEIVPSLSIGATLGGFLAMIMGMSVAIGAAIGMAVLFSTVTKCPIATIFICYEMFGITVLPLCVIAIVVSVFISSKKGLYVEKQNQLSITNLIKKA